MLVKQIPVGTMANFVYLVADERAGEALVVDSGWETDPILKAAEEVGARVKFAVATHEHFDHTQTLRELAGVTGAKVVAYASSPIDCDLRLADGQELVVGGRSIKVIHTPGHTEDSICLYDGSNLFTGDTLFIGTIGRFERERAPQMYRSLHEIIAALPNNTVLFPGHDYGDVRSRTLGEEKQSNPYLGPRDLRSFLSLFS